nr:hypothetical protein [Tanacetum cinerariifolium]
MKRNDFGVEASDGVNKNKVDTYKHVAVKHRRAYENNNSKSLVLETRSRPRTFYNSISTLKPNQKACLEHIGFGNFVEFKVDGIPSKLGLYVVDKFDAKKMEIKLAEGSLKITKNLISEMLGIRNEGIDIMVEEGQIKTKGFCDLKILDYIRPDTDMANIKWCEYVLRCLQSCKQEWIKGKKNCFCGPLTFLTMAYVDGSKCSSFNVVRKRPPTLVWTSKLLREREDEELNSRGFRFGEIEGPFVEQEDHMPDNIEGFVWKLNKYVKSIIKEKSGFENTLDAAEYIFLGKLAGFFERCMDALKYQGCRKEGSSNANISDANRAADAQADEQNNKGASFVSVQAMIREGAISLGDEHVNIGMDQEGTDVVTPVATTQEPNLASKISNPVPLRPIPLRVCPPGTAVGRLRRDTDKKPVTISKLRKSPFIGRVVDADVDNRGHKFLFVADLKNSHPLLIVHEKNEKIVRKRVKKKIGACENLTVAAMLETVVWNASEFRKKPTKVPLMGI